MLVFDMGRIKGDSKHEVVCKFTNGDELQRFVNPHGIPYSAIYTTRYSDGIMELFSCERNREEDMVNHYVKSFKTKAIL